MNVEITLKYGTYNLMIVTALCTLVLSCAKVGTTQTSIPRDQDHIPQTPNDNNPNPTPVDPRLPDFSKAVAIFPMTGTSAAQHLTQLNKIFSPYIITSLLGNAQISMQVTLPSATQSINGKLLLGAEDGVGLYYMRMQSFPGTGIKSSTAFDIIFADELIVVRAHSLSISGDQMRVQLDFRVRTAGDTTCKTITVVCDPRLTACPQPPDTVTPCRNSMNTNLSTVESLGVFDVNFSQWTVLEIL